MKAMILAAGIGSRLGHLTEYQPKALVPVAGTPIIARVVKQLKLAGVTGVAINLYHFPEQISDYFAANDNFGLDIRFYVEQELLDTGGGLYNAREYFKGEQTILVHNADVYTDFDLNKLYELQHRSEKKRMATLLVQPKTAGRLLVFDGQGLLGWRNTLNAQEGLVRASDSSLVCGFCGVQAVRTEVFNFAPTDTAKFSLISLYLNAVRAGQVVQREDLQDSNWFDMGSPERLAALEDFLNESNE